MKKQRIILKMWVEELILIAQMFWFIIFTTECDDISVLLVTKVVALVFMYINHILLARYTDFYTKGI